MQEKKTLQKCIFSSINCPLNPNIAIPQTPTSLSLKPQHRYPPIPNMLKWSYPLNPNIRSAAKREILMGLSRNFLREARQAVQLLPPKPQHAWAELSPKPQHCYPLTLTTGRFLQKKGIFTSTMSSCCTLPEYSGGRIRAYAGPQVRLANQSRSKSSTSSLNSRSSSSSAIFAF